jgi:hypothetical protein
MTRRAISTLEMVTRGEQISILGLLTGGKITGLEQAELTA